MSTSLILIHAIISLFCYSLSFIRLISAFGSRSPFSPRPLFQFFEMLLWIPGGVNLHGVCVHVLV